LARHFETAERPFVSLDDLASLSQARSDPAGFIAGLPSGAIIDEIQRVPDLLLALKLAVDRNPARGRFLLTGSANLMSLPLVSESLAGRMTLFELFPLAESEIERVACNVVDQLFRPDVPWRAEPRGVRDVIGRVVRGGYPEAVLLTDAGSRDRWFSSYLLAMIQRDIRDIADITDAAGMARLLAALAARTGRILNYASLASESGIAKSTLTRYVTLLEKAYLVHRVPAWSFELGRRLTKSPKIFVADSGVAAHLMRVDEASLLDDRNHLGGLLETFVAGELRKHASWSERRVTVYHYREQDTNEVDFVLEAGFGERVLVEVKASSTVTAHDARTLLRLMDDPKLAPVRGIIVYTGDTIVPIRANVHAVPVSVFATANAALRAPA
jgi:hypothetical protein